MTSKNPYKKLLELPRSTSVELEILRKELSEELGKHVYTSELIRSIIQMSLDEINKTRKRNAK